METARYRKINMQMAPHVNFDIKGTFYYDETNNVKKMHIKKGYFNVDYTANFVLGGVAYEGDKPNIEDIFDNLGLQANVTEVKLKHIAVNDFQDCLKSAKLTGFLTYILKSPLYIHFSTLNLLYYSLVDIVDSIASAEEVGVGRIFELKDHLYELCKTEIVDTIVLLHKYAYPNVQKENIQDFVAELSAILRKHQNSRIYSESITMLISLLERAAAEGELVFIMDEEDHVLLKGLKDFYAHKIYMFKFSTHYFDNEVEIQDQLSNMNLSFNGIPLTNFSFIDSKSEKLVQTSDIIIGFVGKFAKFINIRTEDELMNMISNFNELQLTNLDLLLRLVEKSLAFNAGFIHYICGHTERSKWGLIGAMRGCNI